MLKMVDDMDFNGTEIIESKIAWTSIGKKHFRVAEGPLRKHGLCLFWKESNSIYLDGYVIRIAPLEGRTLKIAHEWLDKAFASESSLF